MVNKTTISLVLGFILALAVVSPLASAGWKELYVANAVLQNSDNYDIAWQGPYKGGTLFISSNGGKGSSALNGVDLNGDYDTLVYQKNNYVTYSGYGNTGYRPSFTPSYYYGSGYNGYGYNSGYGNYNTNYARDGSEYLMIDKTNSNVLKDNQNARETALVSQVIHEYRPTYNTQSGTWNWRYYN